MGTRRRVRSMRSAGIFGIIVLLLAAVPQEARSDGNRAFAMAGRQWLLIERMTNSALLAALDVSASPSMSSVHWSRSRFDRTHTELLVGDERQAGSVRPEILATLQRVDAQWRRYDAIFSGISAAEEITDHQVRQLTTSHADTIIALSQMVDAYEHYLHGGSNHSILSTTIDETGRLRAHTQRVLRSLLMVVYERGAESDRRRLVRSTGEFDRILNGLIHGDGELRLISAPTEEILDELLAVERMWREVLPILEAASDGEQVSNEQIAAVAQYANDMAVPLTMALLMYLSL